MEYEANPHEGIGPVRLGMTRAQARAVLHTPVQPFRKGPWAKHETDAFDEVGFHVYYKGTPEVVEFIEVFPVEEIRFTLYGVDVFATSAKEVVEALRAQVEVAEEEDNCSFMLPGLDVSLWRQAPEEPNFEALGVGKRELHAETK